MRRVLMLVCLVALLSTLGVSALSAQSGQTYYVVAPGDTLFRIAARFGVSVNSIANANGIYNINYIYSGQTLYIPIGDVYHPPQQPPPPYPQPGGNTYVVMPGDSLGSIAQRFGTTIYALASANNIWDINHIFVGQVLVISGGYGYPPNPPGMHTTYTVQRGDTLLMIAQRFGTSLWALTDANHIWNPSRIYVGQVLVIPY
jgi:LysM repeat protein